MEPSLLIHGDKRPIFRLLTLSEPSGIPPTHPHMATKRLFWGLKEHLLVLMFPRHKVTSASLPTCLLLFVRRSTEGRAHWRQRWCHRCDYYCALRCPIFDQASLRAVQNVCLHTARRSSNLPVLINAGPVFVGLKIILIPLPQAHLSLHWDTPSQMEHLSHLMMPGLFTISFISF